MVLHITWIFFLALLNEMELSLLILLGIGFHPCCMVFTCMFTIVLALTRDCDLYKPVLFLFRVVSTSYAEH